MMNISCHESPDYVILPGMKMMHARLRLSTSLSDKNRERCPDVVFTLNGEELAAIRTDTEQPQLPPGDGSLDGVVLHDDVLSRAIDEEAWLLEVARVIAPGGNLRFTVPATGPLTWLDSMNLYRYLVDISHRGDAPDVALPTGWNRHYSRNDIQQMLLTAGFDMPVVHSQNYVRSEIRFLVGLVRDNWIGGNRVAERQLFLQYGRRDPGKHSFLTTTWCVEARKTG